jgi:hypothetical protein
MKTQVATLLLVCYAAFLLQPLVPVFKDAVAHMFWYSEHIATVHYENGSYHVHVELKTIEEKTQNTSKSLIKTAEPLTLHLATEKGLIGLALTDSVKLNKYARHNSPRDGFFHVPTPPPRKC